MMSETTGEDRQNDEKIPATEDLKEPSTEKPAGQEPKAPDSGEPEPSHQAVGIGVIGGPLVDPEEPPADPDAS
jgi:hypothetical protein